MLLRSSHMLSKASSTSVTLGHLFSVILSHFVHVRLRRSGAQLIRGFFLVSTTKVTCNAHRLSTTPKIFSSVFVDDHISLSDVIAPSQW